MWPAALNPYSAAALGLEPIPAAEAFQAEREEEN